MERRGESSPRRSGLGLRADRSASASVQTGPRRATAGRGGPSPAWFRANATCRRSRATTSSTRCARPWSMQWKTLAGRACTPSWPRAMRSLHLTRSTSRPEARSRAPRPIAWLEVGIAPDDLQHLRAYARQEQALGDERFQRMMEPLLKRPATCRPQGGARRASEREGARLAASLFPAPTAHTRLTSRRP